MICPHCGKEHPNDCVFCPETGEKFSEPSQCPVCSNPIDPAWLFCKYCGSALSKASSGSDPQENLEPPIQKKKQTPEYRSARRDRSQKISTLILVAGTGVALLLVGICGLGLIKIPAPESMSPVVEAPTVTPFPTASLMPTVLPINTREPGTPLSTAMSDASKAFSKGLKFYIYDPQPKRVTMSNIDQTVFGFSYVSSPGAKDTQAVPILLYVDANGNQEFRSTFFQRDLDVTAQNGEVAFIIPRGLNDIIDQSLADQGQAEQHVNPVTIALLIVGIEKKGDLNVLGNASLSNVLEIPADGGQ